MKPFLDIKSINYSDYGKFELGGDFFWRGRIENNIPVGCGILEYPNDHDIKDYEGDYTNKLKTGWGVINYRNHETIKSIGCNFYNDIMEINGYVNISYKDHGYYDGTLRDMKKINNGIYYFPLDDVLGRYRYEGKWENDKMSGKGVLEFEDNTIFDGYFIKGEFTGNDNKIIWEQDNWYRGNTVNGKKHGYGEQHYSNGCIFCGRWKNNKETGDGLLKRNFDSTKESSSKKRKKSY